MLSFREVEHFLIGLPPELYDIVHELRNVVNSEAPGVSEVLRPRTRSISYYFKERGGPVTAGVCGISLRDTHLHLYFPLGALIPDPQHLLSGSGKAMRHLVLSSYETVPWEAVRELIREHAAFDVRSMRFT
jgi:hypothetical protein